MKNDSVTVKIRSIVEEGMILKVGNGNSVNFWHDRWCEAGILKELFPRLFAISLQKNSHISQMGEWNDSSWLWRLLRRRALYDWEFEEVRSLQHIIEQNGPTIDQEDGVYWKNSGYLCYATKCITEKLNASLTHSLSKPIANIIWQHYIPPRAKLCVWLANQEKLKTRDFLEEKGVINPHDAACPFCTLHIE